MVITPQTLFKDYDHRLMPLSVSEISSRVTQKATVTALYYNGEPNSFGCPRIFAVLHEPKEKTDTAVILLSDPDQDVTDSCADELLDMGFAVLTVDYAGNYNDKQRFTLYPSGMCADYKETPDFSADNIKSSAPYLYTVSALRSIPLLEQRGYGKIFGIGKGEGVALLLRVMALDSSVMFGISLFSPPQLFAGRTDIDALAYQASLAPESYVPLIKSPVMFVLAANDPSGSTDRISELAALLMPNARIYIRPTFSQTVTSDISVTVKAFIESQLNASDFPCPTLSAGGSENALYYEVDAGGCVSADVLVSYGEDCAYRNWHKQTPEKIGDSVFLTKAEVYDVKSPVFAYAVARYPGGLTLSTPILVKSPTALGITASASVKRRLVYDSDMGTDDWFLSDSDQISIEEGPFGITGVSANGTLHTFKIGDPRYCGDRDGVLQLMLYSDGSDSFEFCVRNREGYVYKCIKPAIGSGEWEKISLSANEFKSDAGTPEGWNDIVFLSIACENKIIVGSVLWV